VDAILKSALEPERIRGELAEVVAELVTNADKTLLVIEHKGEMLVKQVKTGNRCFAVLVFSGGFITA